MGNNSNEHHNLGREIGTLPEGRPPLRFLEEREYFGPAEEIAELRQDLQHANQEIARLTIELESARQQSVTDPLTGLANRRGIDLSFSATVNALKRSMKGTDEHRKAPNVVALMIDLDHFKSVNDLYGHSLGDRMLVIVSNLMREYFGHRQGEILGRWGGEEFLVILPQSSIQYAERQAELFRSAVERTIVHLTRQEKLSVTVSIGIAEISITDLHRTSQSLLDELVTRADALLYSAKDAGRNCIKK